MKNSSILTAVLPLFALACADAGDGPDASDTTAVLKALPQFYVAFGHERTHPSLDAVGVGPYIEKLVTEDDCRDVDCTDPAVGHAEGYWTVRITDGAGLTTNANGSVCTAFKAAHSSPATFTVDFDVNAHSSAYKATEGTDFNLIDGWNGSVTLSRTLQMDYAACAQNIFGRFYRDDGSEDDVEQILLSLTDAEIDGVDLPILAGRDEGRWLLLDARGQ